MKLVLKKINLKEEIERDIESNNYDIDKFLDYIKENLKKANFLIENKILDLDEQELYYALKELFEIKFDNQDYLEILSDLYRKHYTDITTIQTTMIDENGYNIEYIGASTKKIPNYNKRVKLSELRDITNSYDFVVLKQVKHKLIEEFKQSEKYENHQFISFDKKIDENSELFENILNLLKKTIRNKSVSKQVLSDLQKYINELMYQAKCITKLSESDDTQLKQIGRQYKQAFEENFNKKQLTQKNNHKRRY